MVQMRESFLRIEDVDPRGGGIWNDEHVRGIDAFQPRMFERSKPRPSVKISSLSSLSVVVKCCHVPGKSVNVKSTSLISFRCGNLVKNPLAVVPLRESYATMAGLTVGRGEK